MLKLVLTLLFFSATTFGADDHATISLQRFEDKLVVTIDHDKGWHTYWKNPGDAGIASTFKFTGNDKSVVKLKAYEWPIPEKHLEAGNILTIGYEGKQHFFFENYPDDINAHVGVLICKDICIPGEAKLQLKKGQSFTASRSASAYPSDELGQAFKDLPMEGVVPSNFEYYLTRVKDQNILTLHYSIKGLKNFKLPKKLHLLTPFPQAPFGFKRETLFVEGDTLYGKTEIEWDGEYQDPQLPLPESGNFSQVYELPFLLNAQGMDKIQKIQLKIKDFSLASPSLDQFYKSLTPHDGKFDKVSSVSTTSGNIFQYLFFAFLGGLILNLMPCVLPVISLKLFSLIRHQNYSQKQLIQHNASYTAGIVATFMALALVIAGLKATGEEVGWGFQLQSPAFILIMMLVLFIFSLNLFGLFEFKTPGGAKLGNAQTEDGFVGDFFSGVLTTILSTPCSAPFLGTALTFAFTTDYTTIFIMFFFIGLGLAFPFILTSIFPKSLSLFPRPGVWMEKLKYFLGFSLIATVIWLYDVFVSLVDFDVISWRLNLLFAFWFFAFFFVQKIARHKFLVLAIFLLPIIQTVFAIRDLELRPTTTALMSKETKWKPWSEEVLAEEMGKLVFMDFTAEWCLTCKVNKKLVLETNGFEALSKKYHLVLLRADWTKRDDNITRYLKSHGAVGVPAYFVQRPNGEIIFLGETITLSKIENAFN